VSTFLIFTVTYTFKSWIPTLFAEFGLSKYDAGLGLAYYSLGGVLAGLLLIPTSAKFGAARPMILMTAIAAVATALLGAASIPQALLMIVILLVGAGITTGTIGQTALCVALYERPLRTTGVGVSAAFGRTGSILGPAAGGVLIALAWPAQDIMLLLALPLAATALGWILLYVLLKKRRPTPIVRAPEMADK
jgi:AAHS family 4-hydroxybenzoate transporter-like MFS transporter